MRNSQFIVKLIGFLDEKGRSFLFFVFITSLLSAIILSFTPFYLAKITQFFNDDISDNVTMIYVLGAAYVITIAMQKIFMFVSSYLQNHLRVESIIGMSKCYLGNLYINMKTTSQYENTGDITHRLNQATNDVYTLIRLVATSLLPLVIQIFISILIIIQSGDYFVSTLFIAYAAIFTVINYFYSQKIISARNEQIENSMKTYSIITDSVRNISVIRGFNTFNYFFSRFKKTLNNDGISQNRYWIYNFHSQIAAGCINLLFIGFIFFCTLAAVLQSEATLSHFILITSYILLLTTPIEGLGQSITELRESVNSLKKFTESFLFDTETDIKDEDSTLWNYDINLKDIHYQYQSTSPFNLGPLSMVIPQGRFITITGVNGSGKSTLVKIITRQIIDFDGEYTINNQPVAEVSIASFCGALSYVSQEEFIFKDTLEFNLKVANPAATTEEMLAAIRMSGLSETTYKDILQKPLSDGGGNISGGQRKKLSLARLYLRQAKIIVLDEVTSSMDINAEKEAFSNIRKHFPHATIINITHRSPSLRISDTIYVLKDGQIIESGGFDELSSTDSYIGDLMKNLAASGSSEDSVRM